MPLNRKRFVFFFFFSFSQNYCNNNNDTNNIRTDLFETVWDIKSGQRYKNSPGQHIPISMVCYYIPTIDGYITPSSFLVKVIFEISKIHTITRN